MLFIFFLIFLTISVGNTFAGLQSPPVQVQLRSPWSNPPLLLEILESVHEESSKTTNIFDLIEKLLNPSTLSVNPKNVKGRGKVKSINLNHASDFEIFKRSQSIIEENNFLSSLSQQLTFNSSLALRSQIPKISAFWQLYESSGLHERWLQKQTQSRKKECESWIDFDDKVICDEGELVKAVKQVKGYVKKPFPALLNIDHILNKTETAPTAIFYADPYSSNFWTLHHKLTEYAIGSRLQYVLRWKPSIKRGDPFLPGYGAYLDLKKEDYLVIDDRKLQDTENVTTHLPEKLYDMKNGPPIDLQDRQWLDDVLYATMDDKQQKIGNLSTEEIDTLGLKAAYTILQSSNPLRTLKQLSNNFPSHAIALARSAKQPDSDFIQTVEILHSTRILAGERENIWLNGNPINEKDFHPFGLLDIMRSERRLKESFPDVDHTVQRIEANEIEEDNHNIGFFFGQNSKSIKVMDKSEVKKLSFSFGNPRKSSLHFSIILDPLGKSVQRWSDILSMLSEQSDVYVRVALNPRKSFRELPLRKYYRSSMPTKLDFDREGKIVSPSLTFNGMPKDSVLTMGLDTPPAWLTMPMEAIYDLDNIRLRDVKTQTLHAVYDLKYVLIEGHCHEDAEEDHNDIHDFIKAIGKGSIQKNIPEGNRKGIPSGIQLILESLDGKQTLDTIVVANSAYFQFRALPGVYRLRIREGRSSELYEIMNTGNVGNDVTNEHIVLHTFQGSTIFPEMKRKLENDEEYEMVTKEKEKVIISANNEVQNVIPSNEIKSTYSKQAKINVFTVASGHLYERMTYIMVLSVLKHTQSSVKFWFIENYLSPSFKSFIPIMAKEFGFDYELVTYAWPEWLRKQTEKQREIWGTKVLFLDVLFPLDLEKVIFVDADQIVRTDLLDLINIDLHGAPYGLPPMGNDSIDMQGYRFWEYGYWEKFLKGKPYPISALFVIDLNKFRSLKAGDKLRGQYQALSSDPNSLSNLDQDLLASMIHEVEIFSLPKEWLWCETWCSWDWYNEAKSIDLCSNPKTHEPKLDRARRQIPEWTTLDNEIAEVAKRFDLTKSIIPVSVDVKKKEKKKSRVIKFVPDRHDEF